MRYPKKICLLLIFIAEKALSDIWYIAFLFDLKKPNAHTTQTVK